MKHALITGITGQDGSYLAELLLEKSYQVFGLVRRSSSISRPRIDHLVHQASAGVEALNSSLHLLYGDMGDSSSLARMIRDVQPDEVYNLAAMSFVPSYPLPAKQRVS